MSQLEQPEPEHKYKTIAVTDDVYEELVILKASMKKKNMNEVIRELINSYKKTEEGKDFVGEFLERVLKKYLEVLEKEIEKRPIKVSMDEELKKLKEMFETFKKLKEEALGS